MASELAQAIQQVCEEKNISMESVIETIESALGAAYRKDFGNKLQNIDVKFDRETGGFQVFDVKEVVEDELKEVYEKIREERMKLQEEMEAEGKPVDMEEINKKLGIEAHNEEEDEDVKKFNPKTMISYTEAREIDKKAKLGQELIQKLEVPGDFGRMAAQTAKQVVIQKLREAERNKVFEEYHDKIGELVTGTVQRMENRVVLVDFGSVTAVMPIEESIRGENYSPGSRYKFYLKSVEQGPKGPRVIISRVHPEILRKLFRIEVPEIASGTVQIKSIAREAGSRSKIAVSAKEDNIDPIGSCVGQRGTRVQTIINELGGEKIDIIEWEDDMVKFIAKALSPAKVISVDLEEDNEEKKAMVYVASDQLSLAIGKEGQNVRLAAKLTGWKIDIVEKKLENSDGVDDEKNDKDAEKVVEEEVEEVEDAKGEEEAEKEIESDSSVSKEEGVEEKTKEKAGEEESVKEKKVEKKVVNNEEASEKDAEGDKTEEGDEKKDESKK